MDSAVYENVLFVLILANVLVLFGTIPLIVWAVRILIQDPHRPASVPPRPAVEVPGTQVARRQDFPTFPGHYRWPTEEKPIVRRSDLLRAEHRRDYFNVEFRQLRPHSGQH